MYIGLSSTGSTQVEGLRRCHEDMSETKHGTANDLSWCNPPKKRFLHHQVNNSVNGDETETWQDKGSNNRAISSTALRNHDNNNASPAAGTCCTGVNYSYRWHWKEPIKDHPSSSGAIIDDSHGTTSKINHSSQSVTLPPVPTTTTVLPNQPLSQSGQSSTMSVTSTCNDLQSIASLPYRQSDIGNMDTESFDSPGYMYMSDKNAFFDHFLLSNSLLLGASHQNEENQRNMATTIDRQNNLNNNSQVECNQFVESWTFNGRNSSNVSSAETADLCKLSESTLFMDSHSYVTCNNETRNHGGSSFYNTTEAVGSHKTHFIEDSLDQLFFEFNGGYRNNQNVHCKGTVSAKSDCDVVNLPSAIANEMTTHTSSNHQSLDTILKLCPNENLHISKPMLLEPTYSVIDVHYKDSSTCSSLESSPCSSRVSSSQTDRPSQETQTDCLQDEAPNCQVCGEKTAGFHCGAFVCEACKKFFIRSAKKDKKVYKCLKNKECVVTRKLRTLCQYCRYQKCLGLGMYKPGEGPGSEAGIRVIPCRVCSAPSSGYHFGAITCEGCKGFFRRMVKEREVTRYGCVKGSSCQVTQSTRNICKACRYQKCLQVGMSADGSRIGRQPNAVKHATQLEMKSRLDNGSVIGQEQHQLSVTVEHSTNQTLTTEHSSELPSNQILSSGTSPSAIYRTTTTEITGSDSIYYTESPNIPAENASEISSVCSNHNHQISAKTSPQNQREYPNPCTAVMPVNNNTADLTAASTASEIDIFYQIVKAGYELEGLNKRSPDLASHQLEDFKDMDSCWKNLMTQFTTYTHRILNFAKKIPGYRNLKLDDQVSLLRTAMYPIIVLSHSVDYNPDLKTYNYFNFTDRERDLIFHFIPGFIPLREHFLRMGDMVVTLSLDKREFEYLCALILLSPDEGDVIDRFKVWEVQENIAASLQEYEERNYEVGGTRFGVLIARLAEFRMINLQHQQIVAGVVNAHPSFQVPQLFSELFLNK